MTLPETYALLLSIRDREPFIPRIAANGRVELFMPAMPVSRPGLIYVWSVGEGGSEADWSYFRSTTNPTPAEEPLVRSHVTSHYASYPGPGLRLDRDYAALRHERERTH